MASNGTTTLATWYSWVNDGTSAREAVSDATGQIPNSGAFVWNGLGSSQTLTIDSGPPPSAEQRERWKTEAAEAARKDQEIRDRAERLLVEHLTPEQRASYEKDHFFEVVAKKGRYRVSLHGGVRLYDDSGKGVANYCINFEDSLIPVADLTLARKLLLEADEEAFLRTANATPLR